MGNNVCVMAVLFLSLELHAAQGQSKHISTTHICQQKKDPTLQERRTSKGSTPRYRHKLPGKRIGNETNQTGQYRYRKSHNH